jgi:8-oxo-dGTP pyrophosphatase MutT (NUDIX family)
LRTISFDKLWDDLWVNHNSRAYNNEKKAAKIKFESLDTSLMVKNTSGKWISQEYCIPKGRRNSGESKLDCALREFKEETGIPHHKIKILTGNYCLVENFYGSNGIMYRHEYLLAEVDPDFEVQLDINNIMMIGEIRDIKWFDFTETINIFRDYDTTKRNVIYKARDIVQKYFSSRLAFKEKTYM